MRRTLLLWTALAAATVGCDTQTDTTVTFELYTADGQDDLLTTQGPADSIELVVRDASGKTSTALVDIGDRGAKVTGLPFGRGFRLFARGFNVADEQNIVHFYGASAPFDVTEGVEARVSVQLGQAECVGLNRASPRFRSADGKDDLNGLRVGMTATTLRDGRVLVAGGAQVDAQGDVIAAIDTLEIYDPARSDFQLLPFKMTQARAYHTATLLDSGHVLLVGGITRVQPEAVPVSTAEVISLDDLVQPVRELPLGIAVDARSMHQATRLEDGGGSVLFSGGFGADGAALATTFRFFPGPGGDPFQGTWRAQGDMHIPRAWHTGSMVRRSNELAVVAGGVTTDGSATDSVEVFTVNSNPAQRGCVGDARPSAEQGCFIQPLGGRLGEARWGHSAVEIDGGRQVVFVGGYASADRSQTANGLEILRADDLSVQHGGTTGALVNGRGELSTTLLDDGTIVAIGGRRFDTPLAASSRLRPIAQADANGGTRVGGYEVVELEAGCGLSEPRYGVVSTRLQSGTVLMLGGVTGRRPGELVASRRAEIYFPRVNQL